jgi:hypothetical protein
MLSFGFFDLFIMIQDCNGFSPPWKNNKTQQNLQRNKMTFETQEVRYERLIHLPLSVPEEFVEYILPLQSHFPLL